MPPDSQRKGIWHPFTQMQEFVQDPKIVIERGEGSWLIDTEGRRYLDGVSSLWVNVHGHRHPTIDAAIKAQLDKIAHTTLLGLSHPSVEKLTEKLLEITPRGLDYVFYSDNGSTAVEVALKIAYQYSRRRKFVYFENGYHGDTLGAVGVGGISLFHEIYGSLVIPHLKAPDPRASGCLAAVEKIFAAHAGDIAACIIEPLVQGAGGIFIQPPGFLKKLRELCTRHEILLIADEVATGFGRTGKMFACEHEGVSPDILCLAKGLTGGYLPLAATLTTAKIYASFLGRPEELKTFFHGHTYTGNPLAAAAAIANLAIFEEEETLKKLQPKISYLHACLAPLKEHPHILEIRQQGFMVGIELIKDKKRQTQYEYGERIGHQVTLAARERGLIIRPLGNVIVLMPPLSVLVVELQQMVAAVRQSIDQVTGQR